MKKLLGNVPLFLFLIPIFFVLHGYTENLGYIDFIDCLILIVTYSGSAAFIYFLFLWIYKNNIKAAIFASYLFSFFCFFGALHDFLVAHSTYLYKYSILIPGFFIVAVFLFLYLKKTNSSLHKITLFLNTLFIVYIFIDAGIIIWTSATSSSKKNGLYSFTKNDSVSICKTCAKPDIYFLLFDEYESSSSLKKKYDYDNSDLDTFLTTNGFNIQKKSRGNYSFTPLSVASILNMTYLPGIYHFKPLDAKDFATAASYIRENAVAKFLSQNGYDIINYSIFDLEGKPSEVEQSILPIETRLITCRTFFYCFKRDAGAWIYNGKFKIPWLLNNSTFKPLRDNNKIIELVKRASLEKKQTPRFVYAHVLMQHYPFFYDSAGNLKNESEVYHEGDDHHIKAYLDYIPYTNSRIKELISTIQKNTNGSAVIIFMADHGYRFSPKDIPFTGNCENQNAVFLPGKNYDLFYDSITGVNQFRVLFNSLFKTKFTLKADSVVYLR